MQNIIELSKLSKAATICQASFHQEEESKFEKIVSI